jgi:hypothetical protein
MQCEPGRTELLRTELITLSFFALSLPPANVRVILLSARRWRLPAHSLPVSALYVLKVLNFYSIVQLLNAALKHDQRVSGEQMGNVTRQGRVYTCFK